MQSTGDFIIDLCRILAWPCAAVLIAYFVRDCIESYTDWRHH